MGWLHYTLALFNAIGALAVYAIQRTQLWLPLNPQHVANVSPDSAFDTALSFVTNTDWQGYSGESTMSHLTQMLALAVQNFFSAATGIAVAIALIRGFARHGAQAVGNAWVDLTRIVVGLLLPLSVAFALVLCSQGVVQNFSPFRTVATLEQTPYDAPMLDASGQPLKDAKGNAMTTPAVAKTQTQPMGSVASQEAIKMIGTDGGGVFNANSAHPYENPTALTNLLQMLAIFLIPAGLCFTFGRMVKDPRQGWTILGVMTVLFVAGAIAAMAFEQQGNPRFASLGGDQAASALQAGGNMEGEETRFGIAASGLFAAITTAASCGAVNAMHDSFTVLFATFAEAMAEGRSKAQAASLRHLKGRTWAKKLEQPSVSPERGGKWYPLEASNLRKGDVVYVIADDVVPADGEVIEGVASVDESAITGESAPVVREAGGDFSSVTGGTRVLSDWIVVRVTVNPGETFVDRMIAMVENAKRQKTPNEIALTILLVALTIVPSTPSRGAAAHPWWYRTVRGRWARSN